MPGTWNYYVVRLIIVSAVVIKLEAVTVNPLCPTNKIAPYRRNARAEQRGERTLGAFYDLLVPDQQAHPSQLQEEPENDADDCGYIEDYDENDLSSLRTNRRRFFGKPLGEFLQQFNIFNSNTKPTTTTEPPKYKPTRPPSGGYFGTNGYRPQPVHQPSPPVKTSTSVFFTLGMHALLYIWSQHYSYRIRTVIEKIKNGISVIQHIKPVHESSNEPHITYRPILVGAPSGNIIGAVQVNPARRTSDTVAQKQQVYTNYAYPPPHNQKYNSRPVIGESGIFKSFIDLIL